MTAFAANPFVYIFSIIILILVVSYFGYGALDYLGVQAETKQAIVTGKNYNPPHVAYRTNIVAGRSYTQADTLPETFVLTLTIDGEATSAIVSKKIYDTAQSGDKLNVSVKRTRISKRLEVTEVSK